ncbi:MAG: FtsX-like permease family protein [Actinomycetota bacterium]
MATLRFLLKRFMAQRSLGVAVVVTLAFTVGVLVAGPIYADAAREAILSSSLGSETVTVTNARLQLFGDADFDWDAANDAIANELTAVPMETLVPQGLGTVRLGGVDGPSVPIVFRDGAPEHLTIEGAPPGAGEIALPTGTAAGLDVEPGDSVEIVGPGDEAVDLRVSGTFDSSVRDDPFWYGGRSPFPAPDSSEPPPVLVDRATYLDAARRLDLTTEYAWDAFLALDGLPFQQASQVPGELTRIGDELRASSALSSVRIVTGLDTLFDLVDLRVKNLRVPILLVVFQIGAVTLAVLAGVGALTLSRQAFELAVLHSRGFSRRTLLLAQGAQALLYAAVAYPLGLLLGLGLARLAGRFNGEQLPDVEFPTRLNQGALWLGVAVALVGALVLLALSAPAVSRTVIEERRRASREDRPLLARVPVELIVLPLGIFAFIQLRGGTKPKVGEGAIEPLVLAAPTLLLFAASFIALRLLLFVLHRLDGRIGRARRVPAYLAGRRLGRSPGTGFAAALLLLLSMGLLVLATSYRAIVLRNHADAAHVQVGADWSVSATPPEQALAAVGAMPPLTMAVVRTDPSFSTGTFSLPPTALGIDPVRYEDAGWWREDFSATSLEEIMARLRTRPIGVPVPDGGDADQLLLQVDVPGGVEGMRVQATSVAPDGSVTTSDARLVPGRNTVTLALPVAERLLSITFGADTGTDLPDEIVLGIDASQLGGRTLAVADWLPTTWRGSTGTLEPGNGDSLRYTFRPGVGNVIGGLLPPAPALPALVSENVASQAPGSVEVGLAGQRLQVEPVAVATQFPGIVPNAPFVVVSVQGLLERQFAIPEAGLTLNEVWANTPADPSAALREAGWVPGLVNATAPIEGLLAQLPQSLAVGMNFAAALAGVGLVVIGVAAGLYFTMRRRDYEFAALRAMGTGRRQIRTTLLLEQAGLLGFALVAGLGIGYWLLRLVMPYVGTSLGVSYPPPVLVLDWPALGAAVVAIAVATGLALAAAMRTLMHSSVTGVLRGEAE